MQPRCWAVRRCHVLSPLSGGEGRASGRRLHDLVTQARLAHEPASLSTRLSLRAKHLSLGEDKLAASRHGFRRVNVNWESPPKNERGRASMTSPFLLFLTWRSTRRLCRRLRRRPVRVAPHGSCHAVVPPGAGERRKERGRTFCVSPRTRDE